MVRGTTVLALAIALVACPSPRGAGDGAPPPPAAETARPAPDTRSVIVIALTHDLVCPWCRIGHARLAEAITRFEAAHPDRRVDVLYRPFLLEPDTPPEGFDLRERLGAKYGTDRVEAMFERVRQMGADEGIVFRFDRITRTPDTRPGHALLLAAPREAQRRLLDAMHVAYFEEGQDIGSRAVLHSLWRAAGLAEGAFNDALVGIRDLDAALREARSPSLRGVPHFVIGGQELGGAQPVEALVAALERAAD